MKNTENKEEEKKRSKKFQLNQEMIIKIITGLVMVGIVLFLVSKNSEIFSEIAIEGISGKEKKSKILNTEEKVEMEKNLEGEKVNDEKIENKNFQKEISQKVNKEKEENIFSHRLISPEEYKEKLESGDYIHIDIRTSDEYNAEKIAEGLNIDFYKTNFKSELDKLDKSKKYIYYCRSGSRSANSVSIFKELGFGEVLELQGGINNWKINYQTK